MRFEVTRTSGCGMGEKPCEDAFPIHVPMWDRRVSRSPEEHDRTMAERFGATPPPLWLSEGTDHCVTESGIARKRGMRPSWGVDLPDLDALMAFVCRVTDPEHGEVVLSLGFKDKPPRIEIYDDYRE